MARSIWKGPFVDGYLLKKAEKARGSGSNAIIKMWSRRSTILPQFVGLTFGVHNGQKHIPVLVTEDVSRPFCRPQSEEGQVVMGKPARERTLKDNEARAVTRLIRVSPQKLNLLAQMIRGKKVDRALADLTFSRKRVAKDVKKTLESAIANAENNHDLDVDALIVSEAYVGKNIVMKRLRARARGRAARILKPFSQMTVVVRQVEESA